MQTKLPLVDLKQGNYVALVSQDKNVEINNETIDYYRYFDATAQAELLFECIEDSIQQFIPQEINYLLQYDEFKANVKAHFQMPDKTIALLHNFLQQNNGKLSTRRRTTDFKALTDKEIAQIEGFYAFS